MPTKKPRPVTALVPSKDANFQKDVRRQVQGFMRDLTNNPTVSDAELKRIAALMQRVKGDDASLRIEEARQEFLAHAKDYVELHLKCTRAAYAAGEFGEASKMAQWAIERIGTKNLKLIEMPGRDSGDGGGTRVMVGVQVGGQRPEVIDGETN